jgi:peptidoglycan/xylan/chitin deacetylase (PgdA/CDA1 family)
MSFTLPAALVERAGWASRITSDGQLAVPRHGAVSADDAIATRERAAFTDTPPASSRLPVSYQRVPGWVRALVASAVGRRQRGRVDVWAQFPGWPLDLTADLLSDLAGVPRMDVGPRTPVLLTHDIDSPEGLHNLVADFLPIEEAAGARSTNYIVPCAWTLDHGRLEDARQRGHEIGVHGYDHSNRTPFVGPDERRRRIDAGRPFVERYRATGYRAPSLLRTRSLIRDLARLYTYDSSVPTSGGLFPVPNNGCATARPFVVEGITEIPLTLPRDGSLRFLGHSPDEILGLWTTCAEAIARSGGVVVLLTHCEARFSGNRAMLEVYHRFIDHVRAAPERFEFRTAAEVAARLRAGFP